MRKLLPHFILQQLERGVTRGELDAATLFIDISGFTTVVDTLMQHGQAGAETLAQLMSAIFAPLVDAVYVQGGFITGFAGDAFTAVFQPEAPAPHLPLERALATAHYMQNHLILNGRQQTSYGSFTLAAKVGLSIGRVEWGILESEATSRREYYFKGPAIDTCASAEHWAKGGDIVLAPAATTALSGLHLIELSAGYTRLATTPNTLPAPRPIALPEVNLDLAKSFLIPEITEAIYGEFRQTTSAFISLAVEPTHAELSHVLQVIGLLQKKYGGYLNRIDFGDKGFYVLVFWGAPVSYENDVVRALNFVLELRQTMPHLIRAGLTYRLSHAGLVGSEIRSEYTCYGRGVSLAARLMTIAGWGDIWVDDEIYHRITEDFHAEGVGLKLLKGSNEPQPIYRLVGPRFAPRRRPAFSGETVGRATELARLWSFVRPIFTGEFAGLVALVGEPGLGKSRLAHQFTQFLLKTETQPRPLVLVGQADEILRQSLNPLRYFLRSYFEQDSVQTESEHKARFEQKLATLTEHLITLTRAASPTATVAQELAHELDRIRSFLGALVDLHWPETLYEQVTGQVLFDNTLAALTALLQAESLRQPVAILLEDWHWIDHDTRFWLKQFSRACRAEGNTLNTSFPIAIILTSREALPPETVAPAVTQVVLNLTPLLPEGLTALASALLEAPVAPELVELLAARTEGNPFFAEQLIRYLREKNQLIEDPTGWRPMVSGVVLPTDVRALLTARLDRLTHDVTEVVQTASVLGREFELSVLAEMLKSVYAEAEAAQHLRQALLETEHQAVWSELSEWRYAFKHALMRDAAYEMQASVRREALHSLAVRALEHIYAADLKPHYAELAYHAEHGGNRMLAMRYLNLAGDQAMSLSAYAEARGFFSQALTLVNGETHDLSALAELHRKVSMAFGGLADFPAARQHADQALALARQHASPSFIASALMRLGEIASAQGDYAQAELYFQEALPLTQAANDREWQVVALNSLGIANRRRGAVENALKYFVEALALARSVEAPAHRMNALTGLGLLARHQGNLDRAERLYTEVYRLAQDSGNRERAMVALNNLGTVADERSDLEGAQNYYRQALTLAREMGAQQAIALYLINLGENALKRGDLAGAWAYLRWGMELALRLGAWPWAVLALVYFARLTAAEGHQDYALTLLGVAQHHPAFSSDARHDMTRMLNEWQLAPAIVEAGLAQGAALDFDEVTKKLLRSQ